MLQVVLTTPSNPAGLVWGQLEMAKLINMCKTVGSWVVVDQVYHEFLFDGAGISSKQSVRNCFRGVGLKQSSWIFHFLGWFCCLNLCLSCFYLPIFSCTVHTFPCAKKFLYERIVHIFSFSKSFGIPGWRVGHALYPPSLNLSFRKVS